MELWYTEEHTQYVRLSMKVKEHLSSSTSPFQKIDVFDTYEFGRVMTLDGLVMVTEKDEFVYHEMITHVPMCTNPIIKDILVIGAGDGGTVRELVRYKSVRNIDMVEIDKGVVDAARNYLPFTASELDNKKVTLHYKDGIEFVKRSKKKYDLIIVDSTDPIGPGEGLFTREFYNDCYNILSEDGILVNQNESPYYNKDARAMIRASSKLKEVFPIYKIYQCHIPTYPSGHWLFGYCSKKYDPIESCNTEWWNSLNLKTKYYNTDIHKGAFALPNFVKEMISTGKVK